MSSIGSLERRIAKLREEIAILERERDLCEQFIDIVRRGIEHNRFEFERRRSVARTVEGMQDRASFAHKLEARLLKNYNNITEGKINSAENSMLNKAYARIEAINESISEKRDEISSLEHEIERIREAERERERERERAV